MKIFFSSFRNAVISIICAVAVLVAAGVFIVYATEAKGEKNLDRNGALEYALADAGVNASDITITRQRLNQENGQNIYEIAFFTTSHEYEYEIDATSGAVVGMDMRALFEGPTASADKTGGNDSTAGGPQPDGTQPSDVPADTPQPGGSQSGDVPADTPQPGGSQSGGVPADTPQPGRPGDGRIGLDAAKEKAVSDAGLKLSEVTFTKEKLDLDDGIYVYDIDFYTSGAEYEYEIHAVTGAVLDKGVELFQGGNAPGASGTAGNGGYIGSDRAKEIAAGDAGVKVPDAVFTESKLDLDDGVYVYDIDFYTSGAEYEYKIDAVTGAVIDKEMKAFQGNPSGTSGSGSDIGADRAKEIAAVHSGFQVSEVIFTKVELDWDDGVSQYEIEFCKDNMDYEYCIDACTGNILEYECDQENHGYGHH